LGSATKQQQLGRTHPKADRHLDVMAIERQRGTSVSPAAMRFEREGLHINLLDISNPSGSSVGTPTRRRG